MKKIALDKAFTRLIKTTKLLQLLINRKDISLVRKKLKFDPNVPRKSHYIHLYTDDSCTLEGKAGCGYVIFQGGRKVKTESFSINQKVEHVDTKLTTICQGLIACTRSATNILLYTDNRTAAVDLNSNPFMIFQKATEVI